MDDVGMINQIRNFDDCRCDDECNDEKAHIILDNDRSHQARTTKEAAWDGANALLTYTPANCTDAVSVVDRVGHIFKYDVNKEYELWVEDNFDKWENSKTTASERRILFSNWVSRAWKRLQRRDRFIQRMFEQCGVILKKDGSGRCKIHIPGFEEYEPQSI